MNNINIIDTVKYAISMSTITISTEETIHPVMSHELVKEYMDKIEWTEVNILNKIYYVEEIMYNIIKLIY